MVRPLQDHDQKTTWAKTKFFGKRRYQRHLIHDETKSRKFFHIVERMYLPSAVMQVLALCCNAFP